MTSVSHNYSNWGSKFFHETNYEIACLFSISQAYSYFRVMKITVFFIIANQTIRYKA